MQHWPEQGAARCTGSSGEGIRKAVLNHHGSEIIRPHHECSAVLQLDLAIALDPFQTATKHRQLGGIFRIDDRHMVQADGFALGDFLNDFPPSQQNGNAKSTLVKKLCRLYHTRQFTVWKNHPLGMFPDFFKN